MSTHFSFLFLANAAGFSYGSNHAFPKAEKSLARDFYGFLRNFMEVFPEKRASHLYIFGESYAGMYGPSIAREIHLQNGLPENANATINLKVRRGDGRERKGTEVLGGWTAA